MKQPTTELTIRKLVPADADAVSKLALRSKAAWGYPPEQMAVFQRELTITGDEIASRIAFGATSSGQIVGYYTVVPGDADGAELEHLFVDPVRLKTGIGSALVQHVLAECEQLGFRRVTVLSDPNAAGFYEAMKANLVENIPSSIPGRSIPRFEFHVVPDEFLAVSDVIDWHHAEIQSLASEIRTKHPDELSLARQCFEWVRDNIPHSFDFDRTELTCRASDVLAQRTGSCYAKSHLLAALFRANSIPIGFCYQRLTVNGDQPPWCLHGLNAAYLKGFGWYRMDARGNKPGVNAQFTPPAEQLAFSTSFDSEYDFPEIWSRPLSLVVEALQQADSIQHFATCLPDLSIEQMQTLRKSTRVARVRLNRSAIT